MTGHILAIVSTFLAVVAGAAYLLPTRFPFFTWLTDFKSTTPRHDRWVIVGWTLLGTIFSSTLAYWVDWAKAHLDPVEAAEDHELLAQLLANPWASVAVVFHTPIIEEVVFRGCLFFWLQRKLTTTKAIFVSSLLFGFLHLELVGATVFGIVMCLALLQSGSIALPILAHFLNNAIIVLMVWILPLQPAVTGENILEISYTPTSMLIAGALLLISCPSMIWIGRSLGSLVNSPSFSLKGP